MSGLSAGRAFVGLFLVGMGALYLAQSVSDVDAGDIFSSWWPVAIVFLGVAQVIAEQRLQLAAAVIIAAGLVLLGLTTGLFGRRTWEIVWPVTLMAVGAWVLMGWGRRGVTLSGDSVTALSVAGIRRYRSESAGFTGGSLTAVIGTARLDLTGAVPAPGSKLMVTVIAGSADIVVPEGWRIVIRGLPLLGAWDDTTDRVAAAPEVPLLEIQALVIMGGLEVRHRRRWR